MGLPAQPAQPLGLAQPRQQDLGGLTWASGGGDKTVRL
jgi:hypothetical protein